MHSLAGDLNPPGSVFKLVMASAALAGATVFLIGHLIGSAVGLCGDLRQKRLDLLHAAAQAVLDARAVGRADHDHEPRAEAHDQVRPGARIVCVVTMKFRPVRIDENPRMNAPSSTGTTFVAVVVEYGV